MAVPVALVKVALQVAAALAEKKKRQKLLLMILIPVGIVFFLITMLIWLFLLPFGALAGVLLPDINIDGLFPEPVMYQQIGYYPMPCDTTTMNSDFGGRDNPLHPGSANNHTGIDFATQWHSPIVSIGNGTITNASYIKGYGRCVIIDHGGGMTTWYAHLSKLYSVVGQEVKAGTVLGLEGGDPVKDTLVGNSTGHHLHFEVRINGVPVDPYDYILKPPPPPEPEPEPEPEPDPEIDPSEPVEPSKPVEPVDPDPPRPRPPPPPTER